MKKTLLIVMAFAWVMTVSGQIQFGVEAGLNLANQKSTTDNNGDKFSTIANFNGGVFVSLSILKGLTLQPEIMYSGCGSKYSEEDGDTLRYIFNYINVPILLKYTSSFGVFAELGPQIGFLVKAKEHNYTRSFDQDLKPYYNQTDFSAVFGVGYLLPINMGIDFRYNLGFLNLIKGTHDYNLKNRVFQIGIFYLFSMKKKSK
jgi:hypothetical protein